MFAIVDEPIDVAALEAELASPAYGAVVRFCGVVRATSDAGEPVSGLAYEAYRAPAVAEFERIAWEARERFGDVRVAIVHRVGELAVGELAVAVIASSAHRKAAFAACAYAIDALKARAPIWKLERYCDGRRRWVENPPLPAHHA